MCPEMILFELMLIVGGVEFMEIKNEVFPYFHCYISIFIDVSGQIADGKTFYNADTRC